MGGSLRPMQEGNRCEMSARLFVDCDDTLVIYENDRLINPYGAVRGEPYRGGLVCLNSAAGFYKWNRAL